jgi:hypothetical protein
VISSFLDLLLVFIQRLPHYLSIDHKEKGNQKNYNGNGRKAMAPYVHTLVVEHEHTPEDLTGGIEVDTVTMGYMVIIFHVTRCNLIVSNEMILLSLCVTLL